MVAGWFFSAADTSLTPLVCIKFHGHSEDKFGLVNGFSAGLMSDGLVMSAELMDLPMALLHLRIPCFCTKALGLTTRKQRVVFSGTILT